MCRHGNSMQAWQPICRHGSNNYADMATINSEYSCTCIIIPFTLQGRSHQNLSGQVEITGFNLECM